MTSSAERLLNLQKTGQIIVEPTRPDEIDGLLRVAGRKLADASNLSLSADGRFALAYDASHSLALAALRMRGFRPRNRQTVFQVLDMTASLAVAKSQVLAHCHARRNSAAYEGAWEADEALVNELVEITRELQALVVGLWREGDR